MELDWVGLGNRILGWVTRGTVVMKWLGFGWDWDKGCVRRVE